MSKHVGLTHHQSSKRNGVRRGVFLWRRTLTAFGFLFLVFLWASMAQSRIRQYTREVEQTASEQKKQNASNAYLSYPKVALMFLSSGKLHNEPVWRAFFEAAGRLRLKHRPPERLLNRMQVGAVHQSSATDPRRLTMKQRVKSTKTKRRPCSEENIMIEEELLQFVAEWPLVDLIDMQFLFTVYVNSHAYNNSDEESSIFAQHVVTGPVNTEDGYAQFSLVRATLKMLQHGLRDPTNLKFVLLSESCIPIQPPEVIHAQLIAEPRSRVNACRVGNVNLGRWRPMIVERESWRKSSQFAALSRKHAQIAVNDEVLKPKFRTYCFTRWYPNPTVCVADEHYIPTLLAHHGVGNSETDCQGYVTSSEWDTTKDAWHPISYTENEVNPELLRRLATHGKALQPCSVDETRATTAAIYEGFSSESCTARNFNPPEKHNTTVWMLQLGYQPLSYPCPLFSRKFSVDVVQNTLKSVLSCQGTGLGYWCY